ncbi:hypothetical protein [Chlorogloea sp. CCALA 695]|uniref:hypothetical protein n=1 Tax=Chlorogloea sp. CCALA 695 TaxID=2107693 RepID=UPI000D07E5D5|nr:hypothetical protein [Chlorogloea sp. CCALA 695]PSB32263.1 hypothetical protein C7B70_10890 [Chlorogloea sp. CCALA 695]
MNDKVRQVSERSLENLKLGARSRSKGKVRHNYLIMPTTAKWLKDSGNASEAIDSLVEAAKDNSLVSSHTHDRKKGQQGLTISSYTHDGYEQKIKDLQISLEETYLELTKVRAANKQLQANLSKAVSILTTTLTMPANNASPIKAVIRAAIELIKPT